MTECRNCGRDAGDGFACVTCAKTAANDLAQVADLARHLDAKRARLGSNWKSGTIGRERAKQDLIGQRKDGGIGADAEGERQDDDDGEGRGFDEGADGIAEIVGESAHGTEYFRRGVRCQRRPS